MHSGIFYVLFGVIIAIALAGCAPTFNILGVDTPKANQSDWEGPTVKVLVNHITCELVEAYKKGSDQSNAINDRWKKLFDDNFVAATDLNLSLANSESLNAGYSAITPLNALGQSVPVQTTSGGTTSFASGTYNRTLAVSGQLNGTQQNMVDLTYVIDLRTIAQEAMYEDQEHHPEKYPEKHPKPDHMPKCDGQGPDILHAFGGLRGNLELDDNINETLMGIDASQGVNVYSTLGPYSPDENSEPPRPRQGKVNHTVPGPFLASSLSSTSPNISGTQAKGGGTTGVTPSGTSTTTFTFTIAFTVVEGVGGGPNWTLLQAKYPTGSGGNSGSGAGGSSSGGSSGGGSGSGGQLVNLSRTALDTLTMTFSPTCSAPKALVPVENWKDTSDEQQLSFVDNDTNAVIYTGVAAKPTVLPGVLSQQTTGFGGIIVKNDGSDIVIGTISWTGYAKKGGLATLVGVVTKASTQRAIGRIEVSGDLFSGNKLTSALITATPGLFASLEKDSQGLTFWDTIPPCDTMSGPAIQSIWDNAATQAQFSRLNFSLIHQ